MDGEFVFWCGKHMGKTYDWVSDNDHSYILWAEECSPNILKNKKQLSNKPIIQKPKGIIMPTIDTPETAMKPNLNFDNE